MKMLNVWLEAADEPIGYLIQDDDESIAFAYSPNWLNHRSSHALSLSLPLREQPYGDLLVRSFFSNLLQENHLLGDVMQREGLNRDDIVGLLEHLGADCSGAVSVTPIGQAAPKRPGNLAEDYDAIDDKVFAELVQRLATGKSLPEEIRDPSPIAGVRAKISLTILPNSQFAIPKLGTGAPTTHILKLPDPKHPSEARDEEFVTILAAKCGLPVGKVAASTVNGHDVLIIERFDRRIEGDYVYRLHQEDFAQASGLSVLLKYERDGTENRRFDAATIGKILAETSQPAISRELFLRMTLFNLLIGNNDNHAKNNALLYGAGGSISLAPFYDLVPVQTVAGFTEQFSFNIGEATSPDELRKNDIRDFCTQIGIPAQGSDLIFNATARSLIEQIEAYSMEFPKEMGALDRLFGETADNLRTILNLDVTLRERDAHIVKGGGWSIS